MPDPIGTTTETKSSSPIVETAPPDSEDAEALLLRALVGDGQVPPLIVDMNDLVDFSPTQ